MTPEQRAARVEAAARVHHPFLSHYNPDAQAAAFKAAADSLAAADRAVPVLPVEDVRRAAINKDNGYFYCALCPTPRSTWYLGQEHHDPDCPLAGTEPK